MPTIHDTVDAAMRQQNLGQYSQQAAPVKEALVQREQDIAAALLDAAEQNGVSRADATRIFEGAGMHLPTAGGAAVPADMTARLNSLEEFARRNGYRG